MRTTTVFVLLAFVAITMLSVSQAGPDGIPIADLERIDDTLTHLAERLTPSVVAITAMRPIEDPFIGDAAVGDDAARRFTPREPSHGSGIVLTADGFILTNEHVIHRADEVTVTLSDGFETTARLVGADQRSDLAVLKINAKNLKPVRLGQRNAVQPGQWVMAIGNAFGLSNGGRLSVTVGNISAVGRSLSRQLDPTETRFYGNLLQTSAVINPGNSGGPLFNIHGDVIGVNTAISTRSGANEGVGFALPIDDRAKGVIRRLMSGETIEYGFLGVMVRRPTLHERRQSGAPDRVGAIVKHVEPGGAAAQAGLRENDIICEVNGQTVRDDDHLVLLVGDLSIGRNVDMKYYRSGRVAEAHAVTTRRTIGELGKQVGAIEWGGMTLMPITSAVRWSNGLNDDATGMLILRVEAIGAARDSGLQRGQIISSINGRPILSATDFHAAVGRAGEQVAVQLNTGRQTRLYFAAAPN